MGDYVTLLGFYVHVLPHIHSEIAESIRSSQALKSIADGLGGGLHLDRYKRSIQKDLLQLIKDEPTQAYILWQFKIDTDTAQATYLPDDHQVTEDVVEHTGNHEQAMIFD